MQEAGFIPTSLLQNKNPHALNCMMCIPWVTGYRTVLLPTW